MVVEDVLWWLKMCYDCWRCVMVVEDVLWWLKMCYKWLKMCYGG